MEKEGAKKAKSIINEPELVYQKTKITFFGSFEEMNGADAKEMALLTPVEHFQNATALIKKFYAKELAAGTPARKIHFK